MSKKRPPEHALVQREGRKRDGNVCAVCGCLLKPEGHHIIEFADGGPASMQNIITLCHDCHTAYHQGKLHLDIISF